MSILYNKTATKYWYTTNQYNVSKYTTTWTTFQCAIQPVWIKDWIEWVALLETKKLYCDIKVQVWDKIVCWWKTYIVNSVQERDWLKRKYYKAFINESNWN